MNGGGSGMTGWNGMVGMNEMVERNRQGAGRDNNREVRRRDTTEDRRQTGGRRNLRRGRDEEESRRGRRGGEERRGRGERSGTARGAARRERRLSVRGGGRSSGSRGSNGRGETGRDVNDNSDIRARPGGPLYGMPALEANIRMEDEDEYDDINVDQQGVEGEGDRGPDLVPLSPTNIGDRDIRERDGNRDDNYMEVNNNVDDDTKKYMSEDCDMRERRAGACNSKAKCSSCRQGNTLTRSLSKRKVRGLKQCGGSEFCGRVVWMVTGEDGKDILGDEKVNQGMVEWFEGGQGTGFEVSFEGIQITTLWSGRWAPTWDNQ